MSVHTVSASPSYPYSYEQRPIEDRRSDTRQTNPSSYSSDALGYRPMNNTEYSVDQHGTLHRLEDVSRFYSSNEGIGYGSASYVADCPHPSYSHPDYYHPGYSQPTYTSPHDINYSAPYATSDIHNSAPYLHNGYSRISGDSTGASDTYPEQLHSLGNTSVPREVKITSGQSNQGSDDWTSKLVDDFKEFYALHRELVERPHDLDRKSVV